MKFAKFAQLLLRSTGLALIVAAFGGGTVAYGQGIQLFPHSVTHSGHITKKKSKKKTATGPRGPRGAQGVPGPQGSQGVQGPQGVRGRSGRWDRGH